MEKELNCLRCGHTMNLIQREHLFLGKVGLQFGDAHYTPDQGFQVEIYCCPDCGRLEFYRGDQVQTRAGGIARIPCPRCGTMYEMDDPKCPCCGEKNAKW